LGHFKGESSHHGFTLSGHDPLHDCSSDFKNCHCHHQLYFITAVRGVDLSIEHLDNAFASFDSAIAAVGEFSPNCSNQYFAYLLRLQTKAHDVPFYYRNNSLLF
jgi:hypothetical protein